MECNSAFAELFVAAVSQPNVTPELEAAIDRVAALILDGGEDTNLTDYARMMGRKGGRRGGPARAKALTPERRREIATIAANARWHSEPSTPTD